MGQSIRENAWTSSLKFTYDINERSQLFPDHPYLDPDFQIYFKVQGKSRKNDIDLKNASTELLKCSYNSDWLTSVKLGFKYSNFLNELLEDGLVLKMSGSAHTDNLNTSFLKL